MTLKGEARRDYMREYMRRRRAGEKPKHRDAKPHAAADAALQAENAHLRARIAELERAGGAKSSRQPQAKATVPPKPERKPEQQTYDREEMAARMRADFEAYDRERAQWGGRPKSLVICDIERLLLRCLRGPAAVRQTIINALAPHVRDQANIERGIPRRTFRKVLAELHTDRNPANAAAFIAFKKLDAKDGNKSNPNTIVIADDKVRSMSDLWRKQKERSERAREARRRKRGGAEGGNVAANGTATES